MCHEMGHDHFTQTTPLACPQSQIPPRVKQLAKFDFITAVLLRTETLLEYNGCRWESGSRLLEKPCCLHLHDPATQRHISEDINP